MRDSSGRRLRVQYVADQKCKRKHPGRNVEHDPLRILVRIFSAYHP